MTTQVDKSLNDEVPVAHVFSAAGVIDGIATWYEKATNPLVSGWFRNTLSSKIPTNGKDPLRFQYKLVVPTIVTETINGVAYQKVARSVTVNLDVIAAPDSTAAERGMAMRFLALDATSLTAGYLGAVVKTADTIV
jgi:hypothetical protein